jgi:hypothetical protein
LIGGNYGLLDTSTSVPNPDYYRLFFNFKYKFSFKLGFTKFSFIITWSI